MLICSQDLHQSPGYYARSAVVEELHVKILAQSWVEFNTTPKVKQPRACAQLAKAAQFEIRLAKTRP